jgi:FtsH-binding integral membrane protein
VTSPSASLRNNRTKVALWIAVAEGLLTLVGIFPHLLLYALAIAGIGVWVGLGRNAKSNLARQIAWVFAVSQCAAVLVLPAWHIAKWAAITAIVVVAAVALVYLFTEREHHERTE